MTTRRLGLTIDGSKSPLRRILVVDDERVIAHTLTLIFLKEGYDVRSALSGEEGLVVASCWQPDLLLSGVIMGGLNGLEFAKRVVLLYPRCRVILMAAQVSSSIVDDARARGFDFYDKPVRPTILIDRVQWLSVH